LEPNLFTALLGGIIGFVVVQWGLGHDGGLLTQSGPFGWGWEVNQINLTAYFAAIAGFFLGLGYLNHTFKWLLGIPHRPEEQAWDYGIGQGAERYFKLCLDHKVIGIQYLVAVLAFFCVGGFTAMLIRTELFTPNVRLFDPAVYLSLVTEHSVTMLIMASSIVIGPFGNYFLPLMIGAKRMAFPRIEALSFWTFLLSLLILPSMFFFGGSQAGWTGYAPLSDQMHVGHNAYIIAWALAGICTTFAGISFGYTNVVAPSMAHVRSGHAADHFSRRLSVALFAGTRSCAMTSASFPTAAAVCEPLCGSIPMMTTMCTPSLWFARIRSLRRAP
jgi:cytochrome c oxidase subunit 1